MKKPIRKVLKNGLRVVVIPMPDSPTVTTMVFCATGSKYETEDINGISHFLEHMFFKGTKKRKSLQVSHEFDALGSSNNAYTWYENTAYYAKSRNKNFKKITDIIADMYLNSTFPEEEIEKERGVIKAEIDMYEDLPQRNVSRVLDGLMYGNQPAGWSVLGPKKNIEKISREDFLAYRDNHYVAEKTVVVVAGNINPKTAIDEVKKKFKNISTKRGGTKKLVDDRQKSSAIKIQHKATDQTHLVFGFRGFKYSLKKHAAVDVLATILGRGMSSRLFTKLREEMGVAYYARAMNFGFSDTGSFRVSAGVDPNRLPEVIKEITGELKRLKKDLVSKEELEKAKEYYIGNLQMGLESSDSVADWIGEQEIMMSPIKTPEEVAKEIKEVTASQVRNVAKELFQNNKMNLAIIGPHKNSKNFEKYYKV